MSNLFFMFFKCSITNSISFTVLLTILAVRICLEWTFKKHEILALILFFLLINLHHQQEIVYELMLHLEYQQCFHQMQIQYILLIFENPEYLLYILSNKIFIHIYECLWVDKHSLFSNCLAWNCIEIIFHHYCEKI